MTSKVQETDLDNEGSLRSKLWSVGYRVSPSNISKFVDLLNDMDETSVDVAGGETQQEAQEDSQPSSSNLFYLEEGDAQIKTLGERLKTLDKVLESLEDAVQGLGRAYNLSHWDNGSFLPPTNAASSDQQGAKPVREHTFQNPYLLQNAGVDSRNHQARLKEITEEEAPGITHTYDLPKSKKKLSHAARQASKKKMDRVERYRYVSGYQQKTLIYHQRYVLDTKTFILVFFQAVGIYVVKRPIPWKAPKENISWFTKIYLGILKKGI